MIDSFVKYFKIKKFKTEKFGEYHGNVISKGVRFSQKVAVTDIKKFCKSMGIKDTFYNFGNKKYIQSVAGMSGGGFNSVGEANSKNYDLFLTGE
ncbi:Nif3-like dinuclear metal center hexameric protein [Patescibacteria group bacterium]|nr:Nif3-like dinuclear metal center hexameric protein [Patescibacteria group bacterium]